MWPSKARKRLLPCPGHLLASRYKGSSRTLSETTKLLNWAARRFMRTGQIVSLTVRRTAWSLSSRSIHCPALPSGSPPLTFNPPSGSSSTSKRADGYGLHFSSFLRSAPRLSLILRAVTFGRAGGG